MDRSDPMFMRPLAPLVLPAVYDDVLSYEEWLSKVVAKLNEINNFVNSTIGDIDDLVQNMVNDKTTSLQSQINTLKVSLTTLQNQVNSLNIDQKIDEASAETLRKAKAYADTEITKAIKALGDIDKKIAYAKNEAIRTSEDYTDEQILGVTERNAQMHADTRLYVNQQLAILNERIDDIIKEYPTLYDPSNGETEDMQTLVYNLYKHLRYFGMKAYKYDSEDLTADEYDGRNLSATKYDTLFDMYALTDLFQMFNPFTGEKGSIKEVVSDLVRRLQWNAKTTSEADGYQATASDFDASTFNAYEQDTNRYLTQTTPDVKNRSYRNWLFLGSGNSITVPEEMLHDDSQFGVLDDDGDIAYIDTVAGTYGDITITYNNGVFTITGSGIRVYSVTRVFDVSELDK